MASGRVRLQVTHVALDENGAGDMRINATRLLTELLMVYLSRPELYRAGSLGSGSGFAGAAGVEGGGGDVTAALDSLLHTRAVPLLHRMMMSGCDPMPLYAQKVIASLLLRCAVLCWLQCRPSSARSLAPWACSVRLARVHSPHTPNVVGAVGELALTGVGVGCVCRPGIWCIQHAFYAVCIGRGHSTADKLLPCTTRVE